MIALSARIKQNQVENTQIFPLNPHKGLQSNNAEWTFWGFACLVTVVASHQMPKCYCGQRGKHLVLSSLQVRECSWCRQEAPLCGDHPELLWRNYLASQPCFSTLNTSLKWSVFHQRSQSVSGSSVLAACCCRDAGVTIPAGSAPPCTSVCLQAKNLPGNSGVYKLSGMPNMTFSTCTLSWVSASSVLGGM